MTPALYFVMLYVVDLEASLTYLTETLGFARAPEQDTPIFRYLRSGDGGMDFAIRQATDDSLPPGAAELYFKTPNVTDLHTTWSAQGIGVSPIVNRPFGSFFTVHTPDGQPLFMIEPRG